MPIPATRRASQLETVIENFTGYKNKNAAIWARGEDHVFKDMKLADNGIGYTHAYPGITPGGLRLYLEKSFDSLFVGETDNIGNPTTKKRRSPTAEACPMR